jgi:SAM-dependent methyltransferase
MTGARATAPWSPAEESLGCTICGTTMREWFVKVGRTLLRCPSCRLVAVREGLAVGRAGGSIYEAEDNVFEADGNDGYYFDQETALRNARLKLAWVERDLAGGARLLDAGSNFGHFLKVAGERYLATGFDLSPMAIAWSREHFGVSAIVASVHALPKTLGEYDGITCWDVLEHVSDPLQALARLRAHLRPGGFLFLSTPDTDSLAARVLGRRWHYLDPLQHITLFGRRNLARALTRAGFSVVRSASLGHYYRLRYVFDRLRYLHPRGIVGAGLRLARELARPMLGRSLYLAPGDVVVVTAVRTEGQ